MRLTRQIPAYGMPAADGPGALPPLPELPKPGPGPQVRSATGDNRNQPSPPRMDPRHDPDAVPGSDLPPGATAGPGLPGGGPPQTPPFDREESIDIIDGRYIPCDAPYAEWTGTVTDQALHGAAYHTNAPCLNGIYIAGDSTYRITDCSFDLKGHGINDFAGIGSAIMVDGTSAVEITDTRITTAGAIRPCLTANGSSVTRLRRCELYAAGGPLPETYVPRIAAGMMEPPKGLGIGGTCRASVLLGSAKLYYADCRIAAAGWGALSTDADAPGKYLQCDRCEITVAGSGYGIFGDGSVECVMNQCTFRVCDYVSMAGASSCIRYRDCLLESGKYGVMVFGSGADRVPQTYIHGGRISAPEAVVYLKGTNAYVSIDGAEITTGKYLIHTIVDDDPMQQVLPDALCCKTYGMKAALKNMTLTGDIVHEEVRRDLAVTLEQVHLTGRIQNAYLSMTDSHWFSPGDSKVAFVGPIHADWLDAPEHVVIEATAGPGCVLSGSYPLKSGGHLIVRTNA